MKVGMHVCNGRGWGGGTLHDLIGQMAERGLTKKVYKEFDKFNL